MLRRCAGLAVALCAIGLVAGPSRAYPTFSGATGGSALPDDQVLSGGEWIIAGDWQDLDAFQTSGGNGDAYHVRLTYGIGDRAEIGFAWHDLDIFGLDGFSGSAKVQLLREPESRVGLSIGTVFTDLDGSAPRAENFALYAVVSKEFRPEGGQRGPVRVYVGVMRDDLEMFIPGVISLNDDETSIFGGVQYRTPDGRFELQAEWKEDAFVFDTLWSVVARWYSPDRNSAIQIGWTNSIGPLMVGGNGSGIHAGVAWRFGRSR